MKRLLALICSLTIFTFAAAAQLSSVPVRAYTAQELNEVMSQATYWIKQNYDPLGSIGADSSDIAVTAFKRAGIEYDYGAYLDGLDAVAEAYDGSSLEAMQRSLMAAEALGADVGYFGGRDFAGDSTYYGQLDSAGDYIGALTALNSADIEIPFNTDMERSDIVSNILAYQQEDGSFGDIRTTAEAVIALSDDYNDAEYDVSYADGRGGATVSGRQAVDDALSYLSYAQSESGDYYSLTDTAMVSLALDKMGISQSDPDFVKNGNTVMDGVLTYRTDYGGFSEDYNGDDNVATAYALCAMISNVRVMQNRSSFFDFNYRDTIAADITDMEMPDGSRATPTPEPDNPDSLPDVPSSNSSSSSGSSNNSNGSSSSIFGGSSVFGGSSSGIKATSVPRTSSGSSSSSARATTKPRATIQPRATTGPGASTSPNASISPSAGPKITPRPTKKPDLVGPVQIVGPIPLETERPELYDNDYDEYYTENDGDGVAAAVAIIGAFAAAAAVLIFMAAKKLWIFKDADKKIKKLKELYKAKRHRRTEEHRRYEERRKFENRKAYAARGKYKGRK